jgi:predicted RNA-binding Zn-ribbon protein involved in translation (DUF1610 family)
LEQRNQELRVKLTEVRRKLVDVEAQREDIQRTLDRTRLKLFNLEPESTAALGSEALDQEAMGLPSTNPAQSEPNKITETTDKPPCPNCGEAVRIRNNGIRKGKHGTPIAQRWLCNSCTKSWSVAIASTTK